MRKKLVGKVLHYFSNLQVAVMELSGPLKKGDRVSLEGATTLLYQTIDSMQVDRKPVDSAGKGEEVGIKISDKARAGDSVYKIVE